MSMCLFLVYILSWTISVSCMCVTNTKLRKPEFLEALSREEALICLKRSEVKHSNSVFIIGATPDLERSVFLRELLKSWNPELVGVGIQPPILCEPKVETAKYPSNHSKKPTSRGLNLFLLAKRFLRLLALPFVKLVTFLMNQINFVRKQIEDFIEAVRYLTAPPDEYSTGALRIRSDEISNQNFKKDINLLVCRLSPFELHAI